MDNTNLSMINLETAISRGSTPREADLQVCWLCGCPANYTPDSRLASGEMVGSGLIEFDAQQGDVVGRLAGGDPVFD